MSPRSAKNVFFGIPTSLAAAPSLGNWQGDCGSETHLRYSSKMGEFRAPRGAESPVSPKRQTREAEWTSFLRRRSRRREPG